MTTRFAGVVLWCIVLSGCERPQRSKENSQSRTFTASASADSLLDAGEAIYKESEYDSATKLLAAGRDRAVKDGDSASVARADTWLGLTFWRLGQYKRSQEIGESALGMKLRLGLKQDLFRSYNALGLLAHHTGRYEEAADLFRKARVSAEAVHDTLSVAKAIGNLGLVHTDVGNFEDAKKDFTALLDVAHAVSENTLQGNALSNLGMLADREGDPVAAISLLQRARVFYDSADYPAGKESVFGQMGTAYSDLGQPQKAIAYMDSALAVARKHGMLREQAEDLEIYAELFGDAGDHRSALKYLNQARAIAESVGLEARPGDIARAEARELAMISSTDLALEQAQAAVAIHQRAGAPLEELEDRALLAEIAARSGRADRAKSEMAMAAKVARRLSLPVADEYMAIAAARVADALGDPASVLRALPAEEKFERLGFSVGGEAAAMRARAFGRLKQWPEAVGAGRQSIATFSLVRQNLGEGALRSAYTSDKADVYSDLVVALLHLGRTSEAFEVADDARGKALLEHLNAVKRSARATSRDLSDADELLRRIDYLTEQLRIADTIHAPERTPAMRKGMNELTARLAQARSEYEDRMSTVARTDPRGAALMGITQTHLADVQRSLRADEVVVEYFGTSDRLFTFVASRDTIVQRSREISLDELANRVRFASQPSATSHSANAGRAALSSLYGILVAPIETLSVVSRATRMIIVPHSALTYLPFAALTGKDGRPLIERKSLMMVPSASALLYLRQSSADDANDLSVFAPFPDELAGSREEARLVSREVRRSKAYEGNRATEAQVRSMLERGGDVHIASHAVLNQSNPMCSHIDLAVGKSGNADDDGSLDVHELLRMRVRSDLVYLSGCETGAGVAWSTSFRRGQDYTTLSQALLFAGAQNVVATLWRIDDMGASVFAERFYNAMATHDPVEALAVAQRQMIRDPRYSAPRYWAGYTISGAGFLGRNSQTSKRLAVQ